MKKSIIIITFLTLIILFSSCSRPQRGGFSGNNNQEKAVTVLIQEIQPRNLEKYIKITAKLEGITDITVISETSGKIISVNKKLGDWIEAGESLGRIDNSNYENALEQAQANALAAEAGYETATIQMKVSESLYKQNKISESEYLQAQSTLKSAEAGLKGAKAALANAVKAFNNSQFTAPVTGYISEINLEVGEYISMGSIVANIVNHKKIIIKTGVGESDIGYINVGNDVKINYGDEEYTAYVTGKGIKPVTGGNNYPVEMELDNPDLKLLPGMVVDGYIHTGTFENVVYTSIENLREKYDQELVYVINSENRAELHVVELGEKIANNVIITSGLEPGDKLVIDGIDSLSDGILVEVKSGFELN
jgi:RND family efflux transporter MFP subunit